MFIVLTNVNAHLLQQGINLDKGDNEVLTSSLLNLLPTLASWNYVNGSDTLRIEVPDGTEIPDLSLYGEVVENAYSTS